MNSSIYINSIASVSAIGSDLKDLEKAYSSGVSAIKFEHWDDGKVALARIPDDLRKTIHSCKTRVPKKSLDPTVINAIFTSRKAFKEAGWPEDSAFGINFGSSRGATQLTERFHKEFIKTSRVDVLSSPTTTLGNISSWIAQDLNSEGPVISHSITCSTALHAMLNAVAWIRSGMKDKFIVGGSESALTPFTLAQMKALKIYSNYEDEYPCKALSLDKMYNSMVLGEGSVAMAISNKKKNGVLAEVIGLGYGSEPLGHPASLSPDAFCFQKSMKMALGNIKPEDIDVIVTHAPGTKLGDKAELKAIDKVFMKSKPALTNNKWLLGHTLGASGGMNIEMAIIMLQLNRFFPVPYLENVLPGKIENVMVNAVGFGGNAVSILLKKV